MKQLIYLIISTIIGAFIAVFWNALRIETANQPITLKKIIIPPIMMSTGLFMFVFSYFRISWQSALEAILLGIIFSVFLIQTTKFKVLEKDVYLIPSKSFIFILFGLLILRILGKIILGQTINFGELTSTFYLLALGMILTWRLAMVIKFQRIKSRQNH